MWFLSMHLGKRSKDTRKGMKANIYWVSTKHQVVLLKGNPVRSSQFCTGSNFMPVFQVREPRCHEVSCAAGDHTARKWQNWLWIQLCSVPHDQEEGRLEGQEWGDHCLRTVLTCAGSLISQQSCMKGTVSVPIWQVRKLSFRAEHHFWGCWFSPHESFSRSTGFHGNMAPVKTDNGLGASWARAVP